MEFPLGTVVYDMASQKIGTYEGDFSPSRAALRPMGGGVEWDAKHDQIREATPSELAAAQAALLARRGSRALP